MQRNTAKSKQAHTPHSWGYDSRLRLSRLGRANPNVHHPLAPPPTNILHHVDNLLHSKGECTLTRYRPQFVAPPPPITNEISVAGGDLLLPQCYSLSVHICKARVVWVWGFLQRSMACANMGSGHCLVLAMATQGTGAYTARNGTLVITNPQAPM